MCLTHEVVLKLRKRALVHELGQEAMAPHRGSVYDKFHFPPRTCDLYTMKSERIFACSFT